MKKVLLLVMVLGTMVSGLAMARGNESKEQLIGVNDAYIPSGFDSSSDAFVVISGLFPNGCYALKDASVTHVGAALHEVRAYANVTQGMCLMVLVPFSKEVQLGKLNSGEHAVHFINGDGTYWEKRLTVE